MLTVSVLAAAPGGVLSFLVLVAGGGIFLALTRRAAVLGMSRERIPDSMVLGCFMTVGVAALVLFGVCLVGSTGSSSSGTGSGATSPADTASVLDTASVFDTAPAPDSTPAPDTASAPTPR